MATSTTATTTKSDDNVGEMSFAQLFEESLKVAEVGEVVPGTVIALANDFIVVEFKNENGEIDVKVGDIFDVFVEKREAEGGLKLSREKAIGIKVWEDIAKIQEADGTISGRIDNRVKGGLSVDIGVPAFLPYSQIDLRPVKDLDSLIGQTFEFKVLKYNRKRNNVVISRRAILEDERKKLREDMQSNLVEGQVVTGTITNITDYGVFIDLGGMDGLCHITDLSWGRVSHPSKLFKVGEDIQVKILKYDRENDKVS
ncbi:MAG: 30S ribosomal protein S1, partial [Deltaproteobacteria bacterium HGW-Deltaproteobacteria-3]